MYQVKNCSEFINKQVWNYSVLSQIGLDAPSKGLCSINAQRVASKLKKLISVIIIAKREASDIDEEIL
jgi:hypothetical protein